ncbi:hypothetical protein niasHS_008848 [Heterodera schachtii]|uniref:type I protein arginine methyltransferase n=1 Tax=Heterodera schachtii TaxID=97005 RepID=A0ABD2IXD1_HETSC
MQNLAAGCIMSIPHPQFFVRICEFRDCDDDASVPPMVKQFFGKFRLSILSSANNGGITLRLDSLDGEQNGLTDSSLAVCNEQQQLSGAKTSSTFQFRPNDYERMPITEKSIAFRRRNSLPSAEPNNGTLCSLNSFVICFSTEKELGTFRTNLDTFCRHQPIAAAPGTGDGTDAGKKTDCAGGSNNKKRKCDGINGNNADDDIGTTAADPAANGTKKDGIDGEHEQNTTHSEFDSRTEQGSAVQYFQFYGSLFQQQNMLQDFTRTATYQRAIFDNWHDFRGKVVLDVGAGTGILSFFAAQVGAKRVYAVEASSMSAHCKELVDANGFSSVIVVLSAKIEEVELPEQVDIIVSEPMGYMLVNERMLESFMYARKFLRPGGRMFPTRADLHLALFTDDALYAEQQQRAAFWAQQTFHGVALGVLQEPALDELFRQPVVDAWSGAILASPSVKWTVNFERDPVERLHRIQIPFTMNVKRSCHVHGLASWFDVAFDGTNGRTVWLSTAPTEPLTHWYQVRCLIKRPMLVLAGQDVRGSLEMVANDKQSYDMELEMYTDGAAAAAATTDNDDDGAAQQQHHHQRNVLDLKMPYFRYTGQPVAPPPGAHADCPSDQLNLAVNNFLAGGATGGDMGQQQQQQQEDEEDHGGEQQRRQQRQQYKHHHQQQQRMMHAMKRQQHHHQQHLASCQQAAAENDGHNQTMEQQQQSQQNGFEANTGVQLPNVTTDFVAGGGRRSKTTTRMEADDGETQNFAALVMVAEIQEKSDEQKTVVQAHQAPPADDAFHYFSYGSNLLTERIHVHITGAEFVTAALLPDFELTFFDRSERWQGAIASVERKPSARVWGCVWRVSNALATVLDAQECGYHRMDVNVLLVDPDSVADPSIPPTSMLCRTYQYSNPDRQHNCPSPHYKHVIVTGAREHRLPSAYIESLINNVPTNGYRGPITLKLQAIQHLNDDTTATTNNNSNADAVVMENDENVQQQPPQNKNDDGVNGDRVVMLVENESKTMDVN